MTAPDVAARVQVLVDAVAAVVADVLPRRERPQEPQNGDLTACEHEWVSLSRRLNEPTFKRLCVKCEAIEEDA